MSETHPTPSNPPHEPPWRAGVRAARANAAPGAVLSGFAVALLLGYRLVPAAEAALGRLAGFRAEVGLLFAVASTALFAGLIPGLVQKLRPASRASVSWSGVGFITAVWAVKGLEIDGLYRLQAWGFGDDTSPGTVAAKLLFDMLVYTPLWGLPSTVLAYAVMNAGVSRRGLAGPKALGLRRWYAQAVFPVLISNWGLWVPAVAVIYSLPLALQLPVQNLVLCFWSLMLVLQVEAPGGHPHHPQTRTAEPR